ncbi:putative SP-containing protein [Vairimorpha necatrix]|uniref:SP-containing protein n=1 Tax=Vairimorpha necatrix TaxID=6039 RepID=A0AAX4J989_9MICR
MFLAAIIFILKIAANNEAFIFIDKKGKDCTIFLGDNLKYEPGYYIFSLLQNISSTEPQFERLIKNPSKVFEPDLPFTFVPFEKDKNFINNFDATFNNIDKNIKKKFLKYKNCYSLTFQYEESKKYAIQLLYCKTGDIVSKFWRSETFKIEECVKSKLLPLSIESSNPRKLNEIKISESWQNHFDRIDLYTVYVLNHKKSQKKLSESNNPVCTQKKGEEPSKTNKPETEKPESSSKTNKPETETPGSSSKTSEPEEVESNSPSITTKLETETPGSSIKTNKPETETPESSSKTSESKEVESGSSSITSSSEKVEPGSSIKTNKPETETPESSSKTSESKEVESGSSSITSSSEKVEPGSSIKTNKPETETPESSSKTSESKEVESGSPSITSKSEKVEVLHEKNENGPNESRSKANNVLIILTCSLICVSIFISWLILSKIRSA